MSANQLFDTLKPICNKILSSGNVKDIQMLQDYLQRMKLANGKLATNLVQYVAFPLIVKLTKDQKEKKLSDQELEEILSCIVVLFEDSINLDWLCFREVFSQIFALVASSPGAQKAVRNVSEECQGKIMDISKHICNGLARKDIHQYLQREFKPQLGHAVFVCLKIAENEKQISLRLAALRAITALGLSHHSDLPEELSKQLASNFAFLLPGIAMALGKIATTGETQNHKVTVAAIESWQYFVAFSMNDQNLKKFIPNFGIIDTPMLLRNKALSNGHIPVNEKDIVDQNLMTSTSSTALAVNIDNEWVTTTKRHLRQIGKTFSTLTSHPHWKVRRALSALCFELASHCVISLDILLVMLLENIVILSTDSFPDIATGASQQIKSLKIDFSEDTLDYVNNAVMERILSLIRKLPTVAKFEDDDRILNIVQQLSADFTIKYHFNQLSLQSVYLDNILYAFATMLQIDASDPELLQEHLAATDNIQVLSVKPGLIRTFKYFRNIKIYHVVCNICDVICKSFSLIALTDSCIDLIQKNSLRRKETFLLLMLFLQGSTRNQNNDTRQAESSIKSVVETIVDLQIFDLLTSPTAEKEHKPSQLLSIDNKDSSITVEKVRSNVILLSYALQTVGKCSLVLKEDFTQFLNIIMYHLLEKAGDTNNVVSNSAVLALEDIAHSCGHSNLSEFIESSVPYFWFNLSKRLKKIPECPSAPQVLRFTLVSHKISMKTYIEELVEDILDSLDSHHVAMAVPLMTVLLTYTESLSNNSDKEFSKKMANFLVVNEKQNVCINNVIDSLVDSVEKCSPVEEYLLPDRKSRPLTADDFRASESENVEEIEPESQTVPKHVTILVSIVERISYLLSLQNRKMQLICLQIIHSSLDVLHSWENQKLPLFHKLWKPLVFCVKGKDMVVMLKSIEVSILLLVSGDYFLVSRYAKELLPQFVDLLSSQSSTSLGKTRRSGFYLTPGYKLQSFLLEKIPILIKALDLGVKECKQIINIILRYVEKKQPYEFVKLGVRCLEHLLEHNRYLTWYMLIKTRGVSVLKPSSDIFNTIDVRGRGIHDFHPDMERIIKLLNIT